MKRVNVSAPIIPELHLITVYEGHQLALRTQMSVLHIADELRGQFTFTGKQWSVNVLAYAGLRRCATTETNTADVIFLALDSTSKSWEQALAWIAEWPVRRRRQATAVILLLEVGLGADRSSCSGIIDAFRSVVEGKRMDFMYEITAFADELGNPLLTARLQEMFVVPAEFQSPISYSAPGAEGIATPGSNSIDSVVFSSRSPAAVA